MRYYLKCCGCGKPMQRTHKTCEQCYERFKLGVKYNFCNECDYYFKKPSLYGLCYRCYDKAVKQYVETK